MLPKLSFYMVLVFLVSSEEIEKPNILFITADDLGWNDVSFHGSDQIMTPNIDILGLDGIILDQYYTDCQGTASLSSLFTGKYAMRLCTQGPSISAAEDRGIPISELHLLPSLLRELGYSTNLIGKWELGSSREKYLPTERGFDNFFGFTSSCVDYYTYNHVEFVNDTALYGLDFFRDLNPIENQTGYITDVLTEEALKVIRNHDISQPLYLHLSYNAPHAGGGLVNVQAPIDAIEGNSHIAHSSRRIYASMVTTLDKNIGHVVAALAERELLNNTIIIFISDNGAPSVGFSTNFGSNWPLRGSKGTPWEGAVRSIGLIWHSAFTPQVWHNMFHVTDWLPTLVAAAGGNITEPIDGVNHWNVLMKDEELKRHHALLTIDDLKGWVAFREGDFKIILGEVTEDNSEYYGDKLVSLRHSPPSYENALLNAETSHVFREILNRSMDVNHAIEKRKNMTLASNKSENIKVSCVPTRNQGCLYNITADPLEANDLWATLPEIVRHMTLRVRFFWAQLCPRGQVSFDERSQPALHNFVWLPWIMNDEKEPERLSVIPEFPLKISVGDLKYYVDLNMKSFSDSVTSYVKSMADSFVESVTDLFSF